MSKKRKRRSAPGGTVVWRQTAEEATLAGKPRYNGYACGHGPHGDTRYNRARAKQAWRRQIGQEGASRGSFPFSGRGTAGAPAAMPRLRPRPFPALFRAPALELGEHRAHEGDGVVGGHVVGLGHHRRAELDHLLHRAVGGIAAVRSEERRVGKECGS